MRVWRITTRRHQDDAFSGEGTRLYGSRWVPKGFRAVYTSETLSLAVLETLVHMDPVQMTGIHVVIPTDLPPELPSEVVRREQLPEGWRERLNDSTLQQIGRAWLQTGKTVALIVPSAVVPMETNIILNPAHPDFSQLSIGQPEPFQFDGRLARAGF